MRASRTAGVLIVQLAGARAYKRSVEAGARVCVPGPRSLAVECAGADDGEMGGEFRLRGKPIRRPPGARTTQGVRPFAFCAATCTTTPRRPRPMHSPCSHDARNRKDPHRLPCPRDNLTCSLSLDAFQQPSSTTYHISSRPQGACSCSNETRISHLLQLLTTRYLVTTAAVLAP